MIEKIQGIVIPCLSAYLLKWSGDPSLPLRFFPKFAKIWVTLQENSGREEGVREIGGLCRCGKKTLLGTCLLTVAPRIDGMNSSKFKGTRVGSSSTIALKEAVV